MPVLVFTSSIKPCPFAALRKADVAIALTFSTWFLHEPVKMLAWF